MTFQMKLDMYDQLNMAASRAIGLQALLWEISLDGLLEEDKELRADVAVLLLEMQKTELQKIKGELLHLADKQKC